MRPSPGLSRLFRFPRRSRRQIDREIDDELSFHLDMVTAELTSAGLPATEAAERARDQFGDVGRARRALRREEQRIERGRRRADLASELKQDLIFAARRLRRSPVFAVVAVLTLGLGIGATTAIFSVVDGVLLRPLPYRDVDRLVRLRQVDARRANPDGASPANVLDWQERNQSFEHIAFFQYFGHDVQNEAGATTSIDSWLVSEDYFTVLGVRPRLGRVFLPDEFRPGAAKVAIISTSLWKQRLRQRPGGPRASRNPRRRGAYHRRRDAGVIRVSREAAHLGTKDLRGWREADSKRQLPRCGRPPPARR